MLLRFGRERGDLIDGITHEQLGNMIGAYRETITKTLSELQSAGHVELGRRRIAVLDRAGLAALLGRNASRLPAAGAA